MKNYGGILQSLHLAALLILGLVAAAPAIAAYADPSGRVARLSHTQGDVSFAPAGEGQWYGIVRNRPLTRGDRLWTDRNGLAEIQVGSAAVRLGPQTSFEILDLHDGIGQFLVTQGTLSLTVRRLYPGQVYEVATPNLAVVIDRAGRYRIDVDPHYDEATIVIWEGEATAYGDYGSFAIHRSEAVRFYGSDLRDYELFRLPRADAFDRYGRDRDRILARSGSLRYVGDDVLGYAELDRYGSWQQVRGIGVVWFPRRVASNWAPYSDGHWVWQEPWGWTWVDNAPWGFAPSHYGRWVNVSNRWGWVPGPREMRPVYAPALVAFVGGQNWSLTVSSGGGSPIGWFPLGPRDVYVPPYQASRNYFTEVNVNNTAVNNTTVTNIYNNYYASGATTVTQVNYGNRNVAGAVTAVPGNVFTSAGSVQQAAFRVEGDMLARSEVKRMASIAPSARSVAGAAVQAKATPTRGAFERPVVARNVPPPAARPFAAREQQLQRTPGLAPAREVAPAEVGAAAGALRRQEIATRNVRLVAEKAAEVDARTAPALRQADAPTGRAAAQRTPPVLDRSVEPAERRGPPARVREGTPAPARAEAREGESAVEVQQERTRQQEAQQQRQRQADQLKEQAAERTRQAEVQQQRQRQADQQQAQAAERTRQAEAQQAQATARARQAEVQEAQAAERARQAEAQQAQVAERARQAEARQRAEAAEKEGAERTGRAAPTPAPVRPVPSKLPPPQRGTERAAPVPRRDTRQQDREEDEDEDSEDDGDARRESAASKADPRVRPTRRPPATK